jgi:dienelactone hydrolase
MRILIGAMLAVLALTSARAAGPQKVSFASADKDKTAITAYLFRPPGSGPFPVVMALHGCSGMFNRQGAFGTREQDWTSRFLAAGYAVLFPDSYNSRGFRSVCSERNRTINPAGRARDVAGAMAWLATQGFAAKGKLVVVGWSNGGSTVLRAVASKEAGEALGMVAFYPGCTTLLKREWQAGVPLRILIGEADDWTPATSCRELAAKSAGNVKIDIFPGAYHDFDAPDRPVRVRRGRTAFSADGSGVVHVGTNEPARQASIKIVMQFLGERFAAKPADGK